MGIKPGKGRKANTGMKAESKSEEIDEKEDPFCLRRLWEKGGKIQIRELRFKLSSLITEYNRIMKISRFLKSKMVIKLNIINSVSGHFYVIY